MRHVHNLRRANSKKRPTVTFATILKLIDRQVGRKRNGAERDQRIRLWHRNDAFVFADANAPLFLQTEHDARPVKNHIQKTCDSHGEDGTKQERENKTFTK